MHHYLDHCFFCNWMQLAFPGNLNLRYLRYLALTSKFDVKNHHENHIKPLIFWVIHGYPPFLEPKKISHLTESLSTKKWHLASETVPFSRSKMLHIETIAAVVQPFGFGVSISQIHWILSAIHRSITRVAVENPQIARSLWQIWQSQQSQNAQNWVFLKSQIPGFLIPKGYSRNQNLPQVW